MKMNIKDKKKKTPIVFLIAFSLATNVYLVLNFELKKF